MKIKRSQIFTIFLMLAALLYFAMPAQAFDPNWYKKIAPRERRRTDKHTNVAAIRGVDEPGDVDPNARDAESVKAMEARKISEDKVTQFADPGVLKTKNVKPAQSSFNDLSNLGAAALGQIKGQEKLSSAVRPLSLEEETEIGREVASNIAAQFGVLKDSAVTEYVNLVGLTVARQAPRRDVTYRFAVLDTEIVNAFAAPGGYIFVTKGLLKMLQNEAELAAILGHEITHVSSRHVLKEIQRSKAVETVIPTSVKATAEKAKWMNEVSNFAVKLMWQGLSRTDELESDREGVVLSYDAGYDPQAFKRVLEALAAKTQSAAAQDQKQLKFLLSTHPKPSERLQAVSEKLSQLPGGGEKMEERFRKSNPRL